MKNYLIVFFGAGLGGIARHAVSSVSLTLFGLAFPFGTLAINVVGSMLMGMLAGWLSITTGPALEWRLFLTTGILGGFTTFSAFTLETVQLFERGHGLWAAAYIVGSVGLALLGLYVGLSFVRALL